LERDWRESNTEKRRNIMGDKGGKKDKDKHNKQVNAAKNAQDEANRKKQEKPHQ